MKYLFPSSHFHYVCVLRSQLDLLLTHMQFCFVFIQPVCLLVGTFNPFTFKVMICVLLLPFVSYFELVSVGLYSPLLLLFSCGLVTPFSSLFRFLFLLCVSKVDF